MAGRPRYGRCTKLPAHRPRSAAVNVDLAQLFTPSLSIVEIFIRGSIMYLALFAMLRLTRGRYAGGLSMADLLVIVLIADAAQNALAGDYTSITDGLVLVGTIVGWAYA